MNKNNSLLGSFYVFVFVLIILSIPIFMITFADSKIRSEIRDWLKVIGSCLIPLALFYLNKEFDKRTKMEEELKSNESRERTESKNVQNFMKNINDIIDEIRKIEPTSSEEEKDSLKFARALTVEILSTVTSSARRNSIIYFLRSLGITTEKYKLFNHLLLENCDLKEIIIVMDNFSYSLFSNSNLSGSKIQCVEFYQADFQNVDFSSSKIFNSRFNNIDGEELIFRNVKGVSNDFRGANLKNADFSKACLMNSNFSPGLAGETHLRIDTDLTNAKFIEAELTASVLDCTILHNTNFSGAQLENASLRNVQNIETAIFNNAQLKDTRLSKALSPEQIKQCKVYEPIIE
ncbi:pentapeptide repeat-containing protein [Picosynechococcus sp. PCC 7117]|uniref:pentapeptide repeat-containing protein n=1 Tax=Picosynechococcus sp. PCC 7117 TaxID=195498 RepID=UPI0008105E53|nr:pentapeptide repeat-containing protein [Picosynechococcus sp. PCC 7117]ANV87114.1 hypothetical protein AWQ22_06360 [Picosynechococcus sp. PCC 7117]